jgi:hypothetical protein
LSEVRAEGIDDSYGPVEHHWIIARKADEAHTERRRVV